MRLIAPIILSMSVAVTSLAIAENQLGPYKLAPEAPKPDNTQILNESYELTGGVIAFVENNLQLSQLCDERLGTDNHVSAFSTWFESQQANFKTTLDFKFAYEKILASLYGDSINETFKKRDALNLKQVAKDIDTIAARDDEEFSGSCRNWLTSIEDPESFFHSKLSYGLTYFGTNKEKLAIMVADPANW